MFRRLIGLRVFFNYTVCVGAKTERATQWTHCIIEVNGFNRIDSYCGWNFLRHNSHFLFKNHRISFSSRAEPRVTRIYEPDQGCSSAGWTLVKRFTWPDNPDVGKSTVLSVQELRSTPTHNSKLKTYFNSFLYVYNITMFDAEKEQHSFLLLTT